MIIQKIYLNYCVIGKYKNDLYIFYKKHKNDIIKYNKIIKINLINCINYIKIYNIITEDLFFENVICNYKIFTSRNEFEYLIIMSKKIIEKSFNIRSYL